MTETGLYLSGKIVRNAEMFIKTGIIKSGFSGAAVKAVCKTESDRSFTDLIEKHHQSRKVNECNRYKN
jgi:hypothetical protein